MLIAEFCFARVIMIYGILMAGEQVDKIMRRSGKEESDCHKQRKKLLEYFFTHV